MSGELPAPVICIVPTLHTGGAERQLVTLVKGLDPARWRAMVVCLDAEGELADELRDVGTEVRLLNSPGRRRVVALVHLVRLLRQSGAGVVLCRGFSATSLGRVAAAIAGVHGTVVAEHSSAVIGRRGPLKDLIDRTLARGTAAWVVVSETQVGYVTRVRYAMPERVHVIPNGIEYTERLASDPVGFRRSIGLSEAATAIVSVAVMRPEKDHLTLVRAFAAHVKREHESMLLIVGDGPTRRDVQREVERLGVKDAVVFLGHRTDVADILAVSDVFVLTSVTEAQPIAVIEAMWAGLPIVASCVGDLPEMLGHGEGGILVPPGDVDGFTAALDRLSGSSEREEWASRALVRADAYDARLMVERYECLFDGLQRSASR